VALWLAWPIGHDLKPRLAESFVEAGWNVTIIPFGVHFLFAAEDQHAACKVLSTHRTIMAKPRRSISSSSQSKSTSTGIKVSVTHHIIPSRVAIRYGVMVLQGFIVCDIF
jgi:hypothetical protein